MEETVVSQYYIRIFVLYSTFIPLTPEICSREQQAAVSSESNPPSLPSIERLWLDATERRSGAGSQDLSSVDDGKNDVLKWFLPEYEKECV